MVLAAARDVAHSHVTACLPVCSPQSKTTREAKTSRAGGPWFCPHCRGRARQRAWRASDKRARQRAARRCVLCVPHLITIYRCTNTVCVGVWRGSIAATSCTWCVRHCHVSHRPAQSNKRHARVTHRRHAGCCGCNRAHCHEVTTLAPTADRHTPALSTQFQAKPSARPSEAARRSANAPGRPHRGLIAAAHLSRCDGGGSCLKARPARTAAPQLRAPDEFAAAMGEHGEASAPWWINAICTWA